MLRLEVLAGGDALRQERLTRSLRDDLVALDGVTVEFADAQASLADGCKGGWTADVLLWTSIAASARPASQLLITAIKEWCAKERHRTVKVTDGDRSIELSGRPDEASERLVREFLRTCEEGETGEKRIKSQKDNKSGRRR